MSSLYTEHTERWKSLASVDYFTQFVKAWISFNAWYRSSYPDLDSDRRAINTVKSEHNKFRDRLHSLLKSNSNDGIALKLRVSELHLELERKYLRNQEKRITFQEIAIKTSRNIPNYHQYRDCIYKVLKEGPKKLRVLVVNKNNTTIFTHLQNNGYDRDDLISCSNFLRLTETRQTHLRLHYERMNPLQSISLLSQESDNSIKMGSLHFIDDLDHLCNGIIEILYKLRNALFHGEIVPDKDTNRVYEPAYHILYTLIQAL